MFYYPNVLQRHTGCFATIWLAATRGSRLVKREYLKVNVVKTCQEILNYVLVRVQPPQPGLPRPRFSLYLSAQLQIGVIRVYFQQCQYLVEDIQHILERLHRAQLQIRIDMAEPELPSLLLPDHLTMMETLEDAPDPFFGVMSVDPRLPSPFDIPQIRHLLEAAIPERMPEEAPPEVPAEPRRPESCEVRILNPTLRVRKARLTVVSTQGWAAGNWPGPAHNQVDLTRVPILFTVLPPEVITLQEAEPIRMLHIEGERDLPEVSRRDLDLLIAEEDEAILLEERRLARLRARPPPEEAVEEPRAPERDITVPPLSPPAPVQVEGIAEPVPGLVLVPEEVKLAAWEPGAPPMEVTPSPELRLPPPPSPKKRPPGPPSPRSPPARRRRRRQLLFWDKETQISREKFKEQLQTRAHCWECPMVQPPERTITSPTELFRTPTYPGRLPPELLALWTRGAQTPPRALRRRLPEEAEEEERRAEAVSEIEVLREAQEPSGPLMLSSELSLEPAEEEKSRISLIPPEERWAWAEMEQPEPPALPVVPELPEVPLEMPSELPPEPEPLSLEAVHRAVALELRAKREPDFSSLVSPLSPRRVAAQVFYLLLVLAAQQILRVEQKKPYGRLLIQPGPRFYRG